MAVFSWAMGLAWFDDDAPPMQEAALRVGGLPLLHSSGQWPACPRCEQPMLFRAQVPLALTSLVASCDPRVLALFECHAQIDGSACDGSALLVTDDGGEPTEAPRGTAFEVVLYDAGPDPGEVARVASSFNESIDSNVTLLESRQRSKVCGPLPQAVLSQVPASIGNEAVSMLTVLGAKVGLRPACPTTLPVVRGGQLVPFDDGQPGSYRTTLPPLDEVQRVAQGRRMRGLIGGATPGYRDYAFTCRCGRPTRTAVRLLADATHDELPLGPAVAQFCVRCGSGSLHRT